MVTHELRKKESPTSTDDQKKLQHEMIPKDKTVFKRYRNMFYPLSPSSLYQCPIERNLWKTVPRSCLADFRGDP